VVLSSYVDVHVDVVVGGVGDVGVVGDAVVIGKS